MSEQSRSAEDIIKNQEHDCTWFDPVEMLYERLRMLDKNDNAFAAPQCLQTCLEKQNADMQNNAFPLPLLLSNSPRPQRQTLQLQCLGLNEAPESYDTNDDAKDIDDIISISGDIASATTVDADMAVILKGTGERLGDQVAFEVWRWDGGGCACCGGEHVDEFEDEEAGECATKVANTGSRCQYLCDHERGSKDLRGEKSHVGTADMGIRNLCVESADGDEHDGAHECTEDVLDNDDAKVRKIGAATREDHDCKLSKGSSNESAHECPAP